MKRLFFIFILSFCFSALSHGKTDTLIVSKKDFPTIKEALSVAEDGDVIIVNKGFYQEGNIKIDKAVSLIGLEYPVIDGADEYEPVTITSNDVRLEGFRIENVGKSYIEDWAAIKVINSRRCELINNKLANSFFGIYLQNVKSSRVIGNVLVSKALNEVNSGNGIHLWSCDSILIKSNHITGHRDGIYFEFVDNSLVIDNQSVENLRYGLHFMFSNHDEYIGNVFRDNGTGVAVMFSKYIIMKDNQFLDNWGGASYGLLFKEIYDGELTGNTFKRNTTALYADGSNRINISGNHFISNGWAINILGSCLDNKISDNNFIGNTFDVATNTASSKNLFDHNYWDQYSGYDLDKDGIGDVPYRPVKVFSYVIGRVSASIILLRSLFIDILNLAERVAPVITPGNLIDENPLMKKATNDRD